jgi:formylglycine-generating enzyme required for sulfatase activity
MMGSIEGEDERRSDEQLHRVQLTRRFAVSDREITWEQFNPFDRGARHDLWERQFSKELTSREPAFGISWFNAVWYCRWLTEQANLPNSEQCYDDPESLSKDAGGYPENWPVHLERCGFRLLTEAEWEYVCRCGMKTAYSVGSDRKILEHYGWIMRNADRWSHPVGERRPNLRGLFDLHGNLYEWCHDWYGDYDEIPAEDPMGPHQGLARVRRGGSWGSPAWTSRSAYRAKCDPKRSIDNLGFRIAQVLPTSSCNPTSGAESRGPEDEKAEPVRPGWSDPNSDN